MIYNKCKVYGPYKGKDGRQRIITVFPDGARKGVSYPKFLMENHLGRYLNEDETVDHIDCDFTNNDLSNLQILPRRYHAYLDAKRYANKDLICPECNTSFTLSGRKLNDAIHNRKRNKAGPFCGKSCAGRYSQKIQVSKINPLKVVQIVPEYTTIKSLESLGLETDQVDGAKTVKP